MIFKKMGWLVAACLVALGLLTLTGPGAAQAHGHRDVSGGKYEFIVGFLAEPAFAGGQNGIDLTICQGKCQIGPDGQLTNPVSGADKTVKAEVIYGSQTKPITLTPRYKADGKYNGVFFPAKAGDYTFHFSGTLNGESIDERFTSAKDGFSSVQDAGTVTFPAANDSTADLSQQIQVAKDSAANANLFGLLGMVVGALGLLVGAIALLLNRRGTSSNPNASPILAGSGSRTQQGG